MTGGDWANNGFLLEGRYAIRTFAKDATAWSVRPESLGYPHCEACAVLGFGGLGGHRQGQLRKKTCCDGNKERGGQPDAWVLCRLHPPA